jgi:hypothetical protein
VSSLPQENRDLLAYLVQFLAKVGLSQLAVLLALTDAVPVCGRCFCPY